jgi:integrase/recombinase XerD
MQKQTVNQFEHFIKQRQYITNVSPNTVEWYRQAFNWLQSDRPTHTDLQDAVIRMREKGLKPTAVNSYCRVFNAYCHWLTDGCESRCSATCKHPKLKKLKEPQQIMPTYSADQVKKLINWKPKTHCERRLHLLVLLLFDCGLRITEALTLRIGAIDLDNFLITVTGKGDKQRILPISLELRRRLFKWMQANGYSETSALTSALLFSTSSGKQLSRDNMRRDIKLLCERLGFAAPSRAIHSTRHTFALNYVRSGGGAFHLQRCLGHTTLTMTRRYANLTTNDLTATHHKVSLLSAH